MRGLASFCALAALAAAGCGATIGTLPFSRPGEAALMLPLAADSDVRFWIDFEATYRGTLTAKYDIELYQHDVVVARAACEPVPLSHVNRICSSRQEGGETHQLRCRTQCKARVPAAGPTLVRAKLTIAGEPVDLKLKKADLVLKQ
jgi:hypothetical protein